MSDNDASATSTVLQSSCSDSPSQGTYSSSSLVVSRFATLCATLVSLTSIAIITYAWLHTTKLDKAPWWVPLSGIVISAIPGGAMAGMLGSVGKAAVGGLLDRIPLKGRGK